MENETHYYKNCYEKANKKLNPKEDSVMQWHTQAFNIATNMRVKIYFSLPKVSRTKTMTWNYHVNESAKIRYYTILGRYLLKELVLNLKLSEHIIKADDGPLKGSSAPMVDLITYEFKALNTDKMTPG